MMDTISDHPEQVLCAANSYEEKYYFNPRFQNLPAAIREELQVMAVLYTEECGGILLLVFSHDGRLLLKTCSDERDYYYDEIDADEKLRRLRLEKEGLFAQLETYYKAFFMEKDEMLLRELNERADEIEKEISKEEKEERE